jgi:hypothetical protein
MTIIHTIVVPSYKAIPSIVEKWPSKRGGLSGGGQFNTTFVFYYFSASEIWPHRRVVFGGNGLIRGGLLYIHGHEIWPYKRVAFRGNGFIGGWPLVEWPYKRGPTI